MAESCSWKKMRNRTRDMVRAVLSELKRGSFGTTGLCSKETSDQSSCENAKQAGSSTKEAGECEESK